MEQERRVITLIPVDLARRRRKYLGMEIPKPSIEHSLIDCDDCGLKAWIGPAQLVALTFGGGTKLCYWCIARQQKILGTEIGTVKLLDATADDKPRRT